MRNYKDEFDNRVTFIKKVLTLNNNIVYSIFAIAKQTLKKIKKVKKSVAIIKNL